MGALRSLRREAKIMQTFTKVGLDALLTPENCVVLLIDHQPSQLANVNSHDPTIVINNVTALAKTAKAFGVPTIVLDGGEGPAIFGPVVCALPPDDEAVEMWQHTRWLVRYGNFAELKRGRAGMVDLPAIEWRLAQQPT